MNSEEKLFEENYCIFVKLKLFKMTAILNLFRKSKTEDTGLRGTAEGRLYVDKKVFYNRTEVREAIKNLKKSAVIKEQIKANRV